MTILLIIILNRPFTPARNNSRSLYINTISYIKIESTNFHTKNETVLASVPNTAIDTLLYNNNHCPKNSNYNKAGNKYKKKNNSRVIS